MTQPFQAAGRSESLPRWQARKPAPLAGSKACPTFYTTLLLWRSLSRLLAGPRGAGGFPNGVAYPLPSGDELFGGKIRLPARADLVAGCHLVAHLGRIGK